MIVVNLFYFSSIHRFLFTFVFHESIYEALAPWKKKNIERLVLFLFVLNFIVLVYNGWKQSLVL